LSNSRNPFSLQAANQIFSVSTASQVPLRRVVRVITATTIVRAGMQVSSLRVLTVITVVTSITVINVTMFIRVIRVNRVIWVIFITVSSGLLNLLRL
jgi:hypothetical protein